MPTIHLLVKGKVQGVFYRKWAKATADANGITGWVRNTDDGNVEITATGSEEGLQTFINLCYDGPARASVTTIQVTTITSQHFKTFEIRRDLFN